MSGWLYDPKNNYEGKIFWDDEEYAAAVAAGWEFAPFLVKKMEEEVMPLNEKGKKIKRTMEKEYGKKRGESIFYASENKGTIKGVTKGKARKPRAKKGK